MKELRCSKTAAFQLDIVKSLAAGLSIHTVFGVAKLNVLIKPDYSIQEKTTQIVRSQIQINLFPVLQFVSPSDFIVYKILNISPRSVAEGFIAFFDAPSTGSLTWCFTVLYEGT